MEVPFYIAEFDENNPEHGFKYASIVNIPAILTQYIAFNNHAEQLQFSYNEERQIIAGPLLIPDLPILREQNGQKFYVSIPRKTITQVMEHCAFNYSQNNVNVMHIPNSQISNVAQVENFQIDRERGIMPPKGFEQLIDGTWWVGYKFKDKKTWEIAKDNYRGFSFEGYLDMIPNGTIDNKDAEDIIGQLTEIEQFFKK